MRSNPGEGLQSIVTAKPLTRRYAPTSPDGRGKLNSRLPETAAVRYSAAAFRGRPTNPAESPKRSSITAGRSFDLWVTQAPERTA